MNFVTNGVPYALLYFRSYKRFVFRLVLSLLVASILVVIVEILEVTPLNHHGIPSLRPGWKPACSAFGFLNQVTVWMGNFIIIWIVGFLCWLMCQPSHKINLFASKVTVAEAIGVSVCFFLPFTFNWLPFTVGYFGPSGHWCWIKLTKSDECSDRDVSEGMVYGFIFYYGPLLLIMLITSIISLVALVVWCRSLVRKEPYKDMIFLAMYPILFNIMGCIITTNRIEDFRRIGAGLEPSFALWEAMAIADPMRALLPAGFFLAQFFIPTARQLVMQTRHKEHRPPAGRGRLRTPYTPESESGIQETDKLLS